MSSMTIFNFRSHVEFAAKLVARECIAFAVTDVTPGFTKSAAGFQSARSRLLTTRTGFVRLVYKDWDCLYYVVVVM